MNSEPNHGSAAHGTSDNQIPVGPSAPAEPAGKEPRSRSVRKRLFLIGLIIVLLGFGLLYLLNELSKPPPPTEVWTPQPNQFPLGTVLQGSAIEFSIATLTQYRPPPAPAWIAKLPAKLRPTAESVHRSLTRMRSVGPWKLKVEAPPFLRVQSRTLDYAPQGARGWIALTADTSRPGDFKAPLVIRLHHRSGVIQELQVPVELRVLAKPARAAGHIVVCETPFDGYSTDDGEVFRHLARVTTSLGDQGVRVDFLDGFPPNLEGVTGVLLAGHVMASITAAQREALQKFVQQGGRLLVSANAFFGSTVARANELVAPYGLQIESKDAANAIECSDLAPDPFLNGVRRLSFHRPSRITVTKPAEARILVSAPDGGGFVAVSEAPGRGTVFVLTQSLWWNWIKVEPASFDNARLLENLLTGLTGIQQREQGKK